MARIYKRCDCPERDWRWCPHAWVVRYRTPGGRSSNQRERSFARKREADNFALKVEHDKRAHVFVDPHAGEAPFRDEAESWLSRHLGADGSITTYRSVLRAHVLPAIGGTPISAVRREDIKSLIAAMRAKGLSASRIRAAHLVISAVFNEAVRDRKLAESPCVAIDLPGIVHERDFILPSIAQSEALAAGLPCRLGVHHVADAWMRAARSERRLPSTCAAGSGTAPSCACANRSTCTPISSR